MQERDKWKEEDPRMLREQIRVADVAFNHLHQQHQKTNRVLEETRVFLLDLRASLGKIQQLKTGALKDRFDQVVKNIFEL